MGRRILSNLQTSLRRPYRIAAIFISAFLRRTNLLYTHTGSYGLHNEVDSPDDYYFECLYSLIPPAFRTG